MLNVAMGLVCVLFLVVSCIPLSIQSQGLYVMNITCPYGWQLALNNCYLFNVKDQLTWNEARTECSLQNSDLMIIGNKQEQDWISIQTEEYKTDGWWIGLTYTTGWNWVQYGGDKTLINWRNEPDNYDEQDCCAINQFGLFSDEFCGSKLGFICSYPIQRGDTSCPVGDNTRWFMTDKSCFFISPLLNDSLHLPWNDAYKYCAKLRPQKGSHLMSVTSADDMMSLQRLLASYDTAGVALPWWTGLNDQHTEGNYVWGVNGPLAKGTIIQWDKAPSMDRSENRNCGVMYQGGSIDDVTCDKRTHYVCEMSAYQGHLDLGCGSWLRAGQSCYLLGKGKVYTWAESAGQCARANAQLVSVNGLDEKAWLEDLALGPSGYWTGLTRAQNQYGWVWQDQSTVVPNLVKWSEEPNNNGGFEDCVEIHKDGLYNDRQCDAKVGYICEYTLEFGKTCLSGWSQCQQSCYYYSPANNSFAVTWYEAKQRCLDLVAGNSISAYRLAINDKNEQACVYAQLRAQPDGAPGYWTDLSDLQLKRIWRYAEASNNEPNYDVITWAHEPNNVNSSEDCAVLYDHGFYNDMNCRSKAFFICERTAVLVSGASSLYPVTVPYLAGVLVLVSYTMRTCDFCRN